jgi:hypothetical protein
LKEEEPKHVFPIEDPIAFEPDPLYIEPIEEEDEGVETLDDLKYFVGDWIWLDFLDSLQAQKEFTLIDSSKAFFFITRVKIKKNNTISIQFSGHDPLLFKDYKWVSNTEIQIDSNRTLFLDRKNRLINYRFKSLRTTIEYPLKWYKSHRVIMHNFINLADAIGNYCLKGKYLDLEKKTFVDISGRNTWEKSNYACLSLINKKDHSLDKNLFWANLSELDEELDFTKPNAYWEWNDDVLSIYKLEKKYLQKEKKYQFKKGKKVKTLHLINNDFKAFFYSFPSLESNIDDYIQYDCYRNSVVFRSLDENPYLSSDALFITRLDPILGYYPIIAALPSSEYNIMVPVLFLYDNQGNIKKKIRLFKSSFCKEEHQFSRVYFYPGSDIYIYDYINNGEIKEEEEENIEEEEDYCQYYFEETYYAESQEVEIVHCKHIQLDDWIEENLKPLTAKKTKKNFTPKLADVIEITSTVFSYKEIKSIRSKIEQDNFSGDNETRPTKIHLEQKSVSGYKTIQPQDFFNFRQNELLEILNQKLNRSYFNALDEDKCDLSTYYEWVKDMNEFKVSFDKEFVYFDVDKLRCGMTFLNTTLIERNMIVSLPWKKVAPYLKD